MKRLFPTLLAVLFLFGCKKDHNGSKTDIDPSVPSGRLAGFTIYQAQIPGISVTRSKGIYSLKYDPAGHLSSWLETRNDSNENDYSSYINMFGIFPQRDSVGPSGYDYPDNLPSVPPSQLSANHYFTNDHTGRVLFDSNWGNQLSIDYSFQYAGDVIVLSGIQREQDVKAFYQDSLYSNGGDVVRLGYYSPLDTLPGGAIDTTGAIFQRATDYSYGQDSNPLYDSFLSGSVGVSVFVLKSFDLFSQHLVVSSHTFYNFYYPVKVDLTYSWTKDASGRVVKGIAVNPDGTLSKSITFTYAP